MLTFQSLVQNETDHLEECEIQFVIYFQEFINQVREDEKEGWPCNRESFSEFNCQSNIPFPCFLVLGCNRQA